MRGSLRRVRARPLLHGYGYRLLVAPGRGDLPKVRWLREWLAQEMAEMQRALDA